MTATLTPITLTAASWLLTYALHSTVFLGLAWLVTRLLGGRRLALEELVWRAAVLGGLLTASLQVGLGVGAGTLDLTTMTRQMAPTSVATVPAAIADAAPAAVGQPAQSAAATSPTDIGALWPWALLLPWVIGSALGIVRLGHAAGDLRQLLADRLPVSGGPLAAALRRLLQLLPKPPAVALSSSQALPLPVAVGVRHPEICVPERVLGELPPAQQEGLCAHELAHLLRRDPAWSLLLAVVEGVLFFQPLNRIARVRLAELAEFRCDDWAARSTGRQHDLARCLATVAEWGYAGVRCPLPAASLLGSSRLAQRVRRLVSGAGADDGIWRPRGAAATAAVLLLGFALVLPGIGSARAMAQTATTGDHGSRGSIEQPRPATTAPVAPAPTVVPAPAPAPAPVAAPAPVMREPQRPTARRGKKVEPTDDAGVGAIHAEMKRLQAEVDRLSAQIEQRAQHLAQTSLPAEAELRRIEEQQQKHEQLARQLEQELRQMKLPDVDTSDLEADIDRLADELEHAHGKQTSAAEQQKIRSELEKRSQELANRLRPSREAMYKLQEKAKAMAEAMRPSQEQLRQFAEQARKTAEQLRPQQRELEMLQQQLLEHTERLRELARRLAAPHGAMELGEPPEAPAPPVPPLGPVSGHHPPAPAPPASPAAPSPEIAEPAPPAPPQPAPTANPAQPSSGRVHFGAQP